MLGQSGMISSMDDIVSEAARLKSQLFKLYAGEKSGHQFFKIRGKNVKRK
jgi:hypothetical protein